LYDLTLPDGGVVVFDLDDTLYPEREFVYSGFRAVANAISQEMADDCFEQLVDQFETSGTDPFGTVLAERGLPLATKRHLIETYREHQPSLKLAPSVGQLLGSLRSSGRILGIITDGRSVTQRNKIRALGLETWIDTVVISEEFGSSKPAVENYQYFEKQFAGRQFVYVGNDVTKDFLAPNRLGWQTVGLVHNDRHIHLPPTVEVAAHALPHDWIQSLA
jgi:putative hydrolase of the HAD superfamily